jgi:hypothetical protein
MTAPQKKKKISPPLHAFSRRGSVPCSLLVEERAKGQDEIARKEAANTKLTPPDTSHLKIYLELT